MNEKYTRRRSPPPGGGASLTLHDRRGRPELLPRRPVPEPAHLLEPRPAEDEEDGDVLQVLEVRQELRREDEALRRARPRGGRDHLLEHPPLVRGVHALVDLVDDAERAHRERPC